MKILGYTLTLPGILLMIMFQAACTGNPNPVERLPWVPTDLASAARLINDKCPEMIDPETRLDSVLLLPERLSYFYTLPNKDKLEIEPAAFRAYLIPEIIENIRTNPKMEMFRDSSIVLDFYYRDRDGELITEFPVKPEQYR